MNKASTIISDKSVFFKKGTMVSNRGGDDLKAVVDQYQNKNEEEKARSPVKNIMQGGSFKGKITISKEDSSSNSKLTSTDSLKTSYDEDSVDNDESSLITESMSNGSF